MPKLLAFNWGASLIYKSTLLGLDELASVESTHYGPFNYYYYYYFLLIKSVYPSIDYKKTRDRQENLHRYSPWTSIGSGSTLLEA